MARIRGSFEIFLKIDGYLLNKFICIFFLIPIVISKIIRNFAPAKGRLDEGDGMAGAPFVRWSQLVASGRNMVR
jgi:hypothetical protein